MDGRCPLPKADLPARFFPPASLPDLSVFSHNLKIILFIYRRIFRNRLKQPGSLPAGAFRQKKHLTAAAARWNWRLSRFLCRGFSRQKMRVDFFFNLFKSGFFGA